MRIPIASRPHHPCASCARKCAQDSDRIADLGSEQVVGRGGEGRGKKVALHLGNGKVGKRNCKLRWKHFGSRGAAALLIPRDREGGKFQEEGGREGTGKGNSCRRRGCKLAPPADEGRIKRETAETRRDNSSRAILVHLCFAPPPRRP